MESESEQICKRSIPNILRVTNIDKGMGFTEKIGV